MRGGFMLVGGMLVGGMLIGGKLRGPNPVGGTLGMGGLMLAVGGRLGIGGRLGVGALIGDSSAAAVAPSSLSLLLIPMTLSRGVRPLQCECSVTISDILVRYTT